MQIDQLIQGLEAKFNQSRIVFWYDPEQSFQEAVASIAIAGVTLLDMAEHSILEVKKRIELDEPLGRFLLYFSCAEPAPEADFLLDIRFYSETFFADSSSMLLAELGISRMDLRGHLQLRQSFFGSKQRLAALKRLVTEGEDASSLDLKMIAVLTKADTPSLEDVLLRLLKGYADSISSDVEAEAGLALLAKFGLDKPLWKAVAARFGYDEDEPSITGFTLKLFCTELLMHVAADDLDWLSNNLLEMASGRATAQAFMVGWRDSRRYAECHDLLSHKIEGQLEIGNRCAHYSPNQLLECDCFEAVEQAIIRGLVAQLLDTSKRVDRVEFGTILSRRLSGHWCLLRPEYKSVYEALRNAELLLFLRKQFVDGFHYDSAKALYEAYTSELYLFDQAYRLFNEHVHLLFSQGAEILRQLDEAVERLYTDWYLSELGRAWDSHIEREGLLEQWALPAVDNQFQFFDKQVKKRLGSKQTKRIFV
ncbi:MAG: BREX-1 system phosphatase PglZ type A, partial [Gammaproteobacteria bacterium]